jgi:tetratricopeptide (TPR) repeat protein
MLNFMKLLLLFISILFFEYAKAQENLFAEKKTDELVKASKIIIFEDYDEVSNYLDCASYKYSQEDFNGAIQEYNEAIKLNPKSALLYYNRSVIYSKMANTDLCINDLNKCIELRPSFLNAYYARGVAFYSNRQYKLAKEDFDKVIEFRPNNAISYRKRGAIKYILRDRNGAILDFDKSIQINPEDPIAFHDRAISKEEKGDRKGASEDFLKARKLGFIISTKE